MVHPAQRCSVHPTLVKWSCLPPVLSEQPLHHLLHLQLRVLFVLGLNQKPQAELWKVKSSQRNMRTLLSRMKNLVSLLAIISNNEFELNVCRFSSQVRIIVAKRLIVQSSPRPLSYPFPHSLPTNSNLSQCKVYSKFYLICKKKTSGEIDLWNSAFLPLWLLNFFFSRWIVWSR